MTTPSTILDVRDLSIAFPTKAGDRRVVNQVSFDLKRGEVLGLVGESGSGKSLTVLSLMKLLPANALIPEGQINFLGSDLVPASDEAMRRLRGRDIGMIFQDPFSSLNPVRKIGDLLIESVCRHQKVSRAKAREIAIQALTDVSLPAPAERIDHYPHQLSGGQRQRVVIALAAINNPSLLIADEPTTALDPTVRMQVLGLIQRMAAERSAILVTHDFGAAAQICTKVAVMYYGRIVEMGSTVDVLTNPQHPYTRALIAAVPRFSTTHEFSPIPGDPPKATERFMGCSYLPRCPLAGDDCRALPPLVARNGRAVACWRSAETLAEETSTR
ncbi:ABC transporter ATP-binding protein [Govanella unica]|uniref:ABC transporter ATP-binding protein n=1 Tax=Govanella unica TaxID=2975056 RepID=A0A9X3Z678_9PROT|nr:ABC transporter ATP-binding protein [Govania unica]MDA5192915.1 ABC transporter ATP-binding protein [Govania unica]